MKKATARLPLNCIDRALFSLHSKKEPMVYHAILTLDGALDSERLKSALISVLSRYPSFRSTIDAGLVGLFREEQENAGNEMLSVRDAAEEHATAGAQPQSETGAWFSLRLSEWINQPLDPSRAIPCRVLLLRKTAKTSSAVFTFHHAAADGLHSLRFVNEVVQEYNGVTDNPPLPRFSPTTGRGDEIIGLARASRPRIKHFYLNMVTSLLQRFLVAPISPNARICHAGSASSARINFCHGSLNPCELKRIKAKSRSAGATVNDILLAACFRTVAQWNSTCGKPGRKISIMVPVDISNSMCTPVSANLVSFLSVSTTHKERADPEKLLREVGRRTSNMLRNGNVYSVVYAAYLCTRFPPPVQKAIVKFLMTTRVYLDTVLLTNLGLIWRMGNAWMGDARITGVAAIPPVVSPMGISLSAGMYNGRLYIVLASKASYFSQEQARMFLNLYLHEIRSYQEGGMLNPGSRASFAHTNRSISKSRSSASENP